MFVVSAAAIFAFVLTIEQMPTQMAAVMLGISQNPVVLLLLTNVFLLALGMIMETIAALMVMTPILVPVLTQVGVDPIHAGVVIAAQSNYAAVKRSVKIHFGGCCEAA